MGHFGQGGNAAGKGKKQEVQNWPREEASFRLVKGATPTHGPGQEGEGWRSEILVYKDSSAANEELSRG